MPKQRFLAARGLGLIVLMLPLSCSSDDTIERGAGGTKASGGSGGTSTGGMSTGGASSGGSSTGGVSTGGTSTGGTSSGGSSGSAGSGGNAGAAGATSSYDAIVLSDGPVAYWAMNHAPPNEPDLTGNGNTGTYQGSAPALSSMPNGDAVADFDGASQYLHVPTNPTFSIPTTGNLCFEAWIRPAVLQFTHDEGSGYVDWMGKCEQFSPTCEWEARFYDTNTQENPNRPNRFSAYVFNPTAGLGSGADWQPAAGVVQAGNWYHVVSQYTTSSQPSDCLNTASYPGSIDIWVDGVEWDHSSHGQTGCMSQYKVVPQANDSAVNIASMTTDSFFQGAIGKVAIYDHLLDKTRIQAHFAAMTGKQPSGSCASTCSF